MEAGVLPEKSGLLPRDQDVLGTIDSNTGFGIFGQLKGRSPPEPFRTHSGGLCLPGKAGTCKIYTVLQGNRRRVFCGDRQGR